jgi:hypothetical protein
MTVMTVLIESPTMDNAAVGRVRGDRADGGSTRHSRGTEWVKLLQGAFDGARRSSVFRPRGLMRGLDVSGIAGAKLRIVHCAEARDSV